MTASIAPYAYVGWLLASTSYFVDEIFKSTYTALKGARRRRP